MDVKLGDPATPLDTEVAREYFRQLVLGLEYLHENDVAHLDVSPPFPSPLSYHRTRAARANVFP